MSLRTSERRTKRRKKKRGEGGGVGGGEMDVIKGFLGQLMNRIPITQSAFVFVY